MKKVCEHCGSVIDQYNGPLKYEVGQKVKLGSEFTWADKRGKVVEIVSIDRSWYPLPYRVDLGGGDLCYVGDLDLTNVTTL